MAFKEKLKYLMSLNDVTQKELANAINTHQSLVSLWLKGERTPTAEKLQAISDFFGMPVDYFLKEEYPIESIRDRAISGKKIKEMISKLSEVEQVPIDEVLEWLGLPHNEFMNLENMALNSNKVIQYLNNLNKHRPHWSWAIGGRNIQLFLKYKGHHIPIDQVGRGLSPKIPIENELSPSDLTLIQEIIEIVLEYLNIPKSDKIALLIKYIYEEIKEQEREISEEELKKKVLKLVKIAV